MALVFALVMLKPVMPYISDTVAHVFWYSQHMATVHLENGKFHVHKETVEANQKNSTEKNNAIFKKAFSQTEFVAVSCSANEPTYYYAHKCYISTASSLSHRFLIRFFPPPKA